MNLSMIYYVLFVTIVIFRPICSQYSECVNPQRLRGQCIPFQQCSYLVSVARNYQQNQEAQLFLSQSQCGYNQFSVFACCPQTTQLNQQQPQVTRPQQVQPTRPQQIQNVLRPKTAVNLLPKPPTCGVDTEDRIFGGTKTSLFEFPWFALLKYSKPGQSIPIFSCSGTLISDRYVVTASHCVHPQILQRIKLIGVRLGEWNLQTNPDCDESLENEKVCNEPYIDVGIEELMTHEKYLPLSFNQHNDIALIRMSQRVKFTEFVKPICLQPGSQLPGQSVVVAGFGKTESAHTSNVKLKVTLNIVETEKCNQVFKVEGRRLNGTQVCAGGVKNVDSCRGDSGGPLMKFITQGRSSYWILVGIVSYGSNPCGQQNKPAVYTRVESFLSWIESKMRI